MLFTLELSITGLVILAVRSEKTKPTTSDLVDVICPSAHMHRPRLSFNPREVQRSSGIAPDLDVAPTGERIAALDLRSRFLAVTIPGTEGGNSTMEWREKEAEKPVDKGEDPLMDWLPTLTTLGFKGFDMPGAGLIPGGASARITLPPGKIECANVIRNKDDKYFRYVFEAAPNKLIRAVAHNIVFRAYDVRALVVLDHQGNKILTSFGPNTGTTLHMCISNDLHMFPGKPLNPDDPNDFDLKHLAHLSSVTPLHDGLDFKVPKPIQEGGGRTGDVICDGALFVYPPIG